MKRKDRVMPTREDRQMANAKVPVRQKTLLETLQEEEERIRLLEASKPVQ